MKPALKALAITLLWVAFGGLAANSQPSMPDTGQTTCYDSDGNVIDCQGTGQDGEFSINPHSYESITIGGDKMVRDNVTGLIWEVKGESDGTQDHTNPNDPDNTYTWYDSNPATNGGEAGTPGDGTDTEDFINAMNAMAYGGHNDWRLPTIKELSSLRDLERYDPAINTEFFPNTVSVRYWSSSSVATNPSYAWYVYFSDGLVYSLNKSYDYRVRAVRGGQ